MTAQLKRQWVTVGSFVGLVLGFLIGGWGPAVGLPVEALGLVLDPLGTAWVNALRLVVVPLVVAQLVYTLASTGGGRAGRIATLSLPVFIGLLFLGASLTVVVLPSVLSSFTFAPEALSGLGATAAVPDQKPPTTRPLDALAGAIPSNVFRAASSDNLFGILLFAAAFGIAVGRMPTPQRTQVADLFRTIAEAMMTIVGWVLWLMPVAVLALAAEAASSVGAAVIEVVAVYVALLCGALFVFTLVQYPLAAICGGVSLRRFATACLPVQLAAISTRSSIACLPLLLERSRESLGLRPEVATVVMPLAVSTFKINQSVSSPLQFMFVAYVYGVELSTLQVLTFAGTAILFSFTAVGIPNGGSMMRSAPLYVAAGIPVEGYLLTHAAESIPDIFKTLLNVTGDMSAAVLVNRLCGSAKPIPAEAATVPGSEVAAGV